MHSLDMIQQQQAQQQQGQQQPAPAGRSIVLVTSPFHQLRSYHTFKRAMAERGFTIQPGGWQLYMANAPFAGHRGYGCLLDVVADQWDCWRELAALAWYALCGYLL